ncbi:hypothetical protein Tco_0885262 [Tanacetum coccineum]
MASGRISFEELWVFGKAPAGAISSTSTRWLQPWQRFCNAAAVADLSLTNSASSADAGHKAPIFGLIEKRILDINRFLRNETDGDIDELSGSEAYMRRSDSVKKLNLAIPNKEAEHRMLLLLTAAARFIDANQTVGEKVTACVPFDGCCGIDRDG